MNIGIMSITATGTVSTATGVIIITNMNSFGLARSLLNKSIEKRLPDPTPPTATKEGSAQKGATIAMIQIGNRLD
jgi:hypothetical protein